ncbi:MAG: alpha-ketoglutarate-dependent dioxygenase AlkB family protein [Acidimicrobiales bacterium]
MGELFPQERRSVAAGAVHLPGWLDPECQRALVSSCYRWGEDVGGFRAPRMPRGGTMSVEITCLGWHWYPYRYARSVEDGDGRVVPPFPSWLGDLARAAVVSAAAVDGSLAGGGPAGPATAAPSTAAPSTAGPATAVPSRKSAGAYQPDVALVNWYGSGARMGMHVDREEPSPAPVVSLSLGDSCVFRFGSPAGRGRPWTDVLLESGDAFVFGGGSRRAYHGVPKVLPGTAPAGIGLDGGRFNITVRETGLTKAHGGSGRPELPAQGPRAARARPVPKRAGSAS